MLKDIQFANDKHYTIFKCEREQIYRRQKKKLFVNKI